MLLISAIVLIIGVIIMKDFVVEKASSALSASKKLRGFITIVVVILAISAVILFIFYRYARETDIYAEMNEKYVSGFLVFVFILFFITCLFYIVIAYPLLKQLFNITKKEKRHLISFIIFCILLGGLVSLIGVVMISRKDIFDVSPYVSIGGFTLLMVEIGLFRVMYNSYGSFLLERRVNELCKDEIFLQRIENLDDYRSFVAESHEVDNAFLSDIDIGIYQVRERKQAKELKQGEKIDVFIQKKIVDMVYDLKRDEEFTYPKSQ